MIRNEAKTRIPAEENPAAGQPAQGADTVGPVAVEAASSTAESGLDLVDDPENLLGGDVRSAQGISTEQGRIVLRLRTMSARSG